MSDAGRDARGARFDEAIDGAVREMLEAEPRADLRDRVIARLPASGARPADGFRLPALGWRLGAVAAAAVIVLALIVTRRGEPVAPQTPAVAQATDRLLRVEHVALNPPTPAPARPAAVRVAAPVTQPAAMVAAASYAGDADGGVGGIEPLQRIAPIAISPITQDRIAPADIAVRPLDPISDVEIAPLTPPERRN